MRQLGSSALGSSQMKILNVHATSTLLKLEGIYSVNAKDLIVKIVDIGLHFLFSLFTLFYFYFSFLFFSFSISRTTWVRAYQSRCHISHKLMAKSQD